MKTVSICIILFCSLLTGIVSADVAINGTWIEVTGNAGFNPGYDSGTVVFDNKLWLIGPNNTNSVWSSEDGSNWSRVTDNASFRPRIGFGTAVFDNRLWLISGNEGNDDVWSSEDGINWTLITDNASFSPRFYHGVTAFKGKLWVIGGVRYEPYSGDANDVWSSEDGKNWTLEIEHAKFSPRYGMGIVTFQDRLWMIGGEWNNDVWSSEDGKKWKLVNASTPFRQMDFPSVTVFDNKLWVIGGGSDIPVKAADEYHGLPPSFDYNETWSSPDGINWTREPDPGFGPRYHQGLAVFQDSIWVIGGTHLEPWVDYFYYSDVWRTSPVSNSSRQINSSLQLTSPSPTGTNSTTAVPTTQPTPLPCTIPVIAIGSLVIAAGVWQRARSNDE